MSKKCDYFAEMHGKYWCILKNSEISTDTYKNFCRYDDTKKCVIYQFYAKK